MATTCKLIAKNEVGSGGVASVTFSSIPGTYTDLLIAASARSDRSGQYEDGVLLVFNSDTANNYSSRVLYAVGNTAYSSSTSAAASMWIAAVPGATPTASTFGNLDIYIPNYAGSTAKSASATAVSENNNSTNNWIGAHAGLWSGTAAITSIEIKPRFGTKFDQYSSFFLFGIKKS